VVEGERCLSFSPRDPRHILQFSSVDDILANSQREFWALEMDPRSEDGGVGAIMRETRCGLEIAERDGTLAALGSTYSPENHAIYDGLSRPGVRLVTFAPVLKHGAFPLAAILAELLEIGSRGMNRPAEIEFAVRLSEDPDAGDGRRATGGDGRGARPHEFGALQMRPLVLSRETGAQDVEEADTDRLLCRSPRVLGNGRVDGLLDLVVVDFHRFDRAQSRAAASEVARFNAELVAERRPFLLIGVGRWGSNDPWLGIPVTWDQIAGARVIVESGFRDFRVTPSQGSHFFQNLTSFEVGYFTVNAEAGEGFVDWDWIATQPARSELRFVRHLRCEAALTVKMNGRKNEGIIYKPGASPD